MARAGRIVPVWSIVVAVLAALVWAVGVPVVVAWRTDYSAWSSSEPRDPTPMPSWLLARDEHSPLPAEFRRTSTLVTRLERQATTTYRNGTYAVFYEEVRIGFPWPSLAIGMVGARHESGTPPATELEFVTILDDRVGWRKGLIAGRGPGGWPKVIPLAPKWGLLANALLVALPILVVATGWRMFVRRRRLARGCCPMCGYGEAAPVGSCSECGWGVGEPASA